MKRYLAVVVVALGVFSPSAAFGLSCARLSLDESAIDAAIMIFEGIAGPKRTLDFRERAAVRRHAIGAKGGRSEDLRVYSFTVTRSWKGAASRCQRLRSSSRHGAPTDIETRPIAITFSTASDAPG